MPTSELDVVRFAVRAELSRSYSASIPPLYSGLARSSLARDRDALGAAVGQGVRTPDPSFQRPYAPRGTEWSTSAAIPIVHCLKIARRQEEQVIEGEGHYRVLLRSYGSFCPWLHSRPIEVQRNPTVGRTAPGSHASLTIPRIPMSVPHVSRIRTTMEPSAMLSSNDEYRYDKHLIST